MKTLMHDKQPLDLEEYNRQQRMGKQNAPDLLNDFVDSVNVARAKSLELKDYVASNHEFLHGNYTDDSTFTVGRHTFHKNIYNDHFDEETKLVNGANLSRDDVPSTSLINGAVEGNSAINSTKRQLEDGSKIPTIVTIEDKQLESENAAVIPEVGNMSNAYSRSAEPGYMAAELTKTTVKDSDTYEGAHLAADVVRMAQGVGAAISYKDNTDTFLDFATSDIAKNASDALKRRDSSFDAYLYVDDEIGYSPDNLKYSSKRELSQAYLSGKRQIEQQLYKQGLDLAGIKNKDIAKSLHNNHFTFGSQKGLVIDDDTRDLLSAYLSLNNIQLSMGKEEARVMAGSQVFKNRAKSAIKGSDTYRGMRQVHAIKRAGGRIVFAPAKARLRLATGTAQIGNRITNARYSSKLKNASAADRAIISAELLGKNKAFAEKQAQRRAKIGKINAVQDFATASTFGKARIVGSHVSSRIKKTELYNNTLGKRGAKQTQKKLAKQQKNPEKYQRKRNRRVRKKKVSRALAYLKKKIIIYSAMLGIGLLGSLFLLDIVAVIVGMNPFSGDKLTSTEYHPVRQTALDNSILSLHDAQDWITNGVSGKYYDGALYQVNIRYPDGSYVQYKTGSANPGTNISSLFPSGNVSTIKNLRIPWTYHGTDEDGNSLSANGYLGQSVYDDIYQLDENDVIINDAPPLNPPRRLDLSSDVINMDIPSEWISAFSTRPQYNYQNWSDKYIYHCGSGVKRYTLDDFYKAISSMAVEVCDITGYDDADGAFYNAYFTAISNMAIKNSYYTVNVTTVPKNGFMQFKDEDDNVYSDTAYLVHCQVNIHLDASINDLMELADHYDPLNGIFTDRTTAIQAWRNWIVATIAATGADNTGYEGGRVYNGFFSSDSPSFAYDTTYDCYRDTSGFAYDYNNMTAEGNVACSYLFEGLTLDEWINDLGFIFLNAYSIDGNTASNMAPIYSSSQVEDYLIQIKSYYYQSAGHELSDTRIAFMRQCLEDVGRFYYAFGGKCGDVNSPPVGLDCSGFVGYELAKAGYISNPTQSTGSLDGHGLGTEVSYGNKKPGDIIVKYEPGLDTAGHWQSHVVIYLGKFDAGDGKGVVERTVECTTSTVSGSQVYLMSKRPYARGYDRVKSFMD